MSRRRDHDRLEDIKEAARTITGHLQRGDLNDGLVYDAVRMRLFEIGEAVKAIDAELLAGEQDIPWRDVAGMRDRLAHHYFDTDHSVVQIVVDHDPPPLLKAVDRLAHHLDLCTENPVGVSSTKRSSGQPASWTGSNGAVSLFEIETPTTAGARSCEPNRHGDPTTSASTISWKPGWPSTPSSSPPPNWRLS